MHTWDPSSLVHTATSRLFFSKQTYFGPSESKILQNLVSAL